MHDVFIHNAVIHDGERFTDADALLVKAGRISWIGPGACAPAHDGVPSVDLEGRTVLPALCDVHTHPSWIAATVRSVPCVSPIVNTIEEMIEALRRHPLAGRGPEAWITGFGYDEGKLAEHRTPTIEDLDRVSTTQPVFVKRSDCHSAICNSVALRLAGIEAGTPDPAGGRFGRFPDGRPNGVLTEFNAAQVVERLMGEPTFESEVEMMTASGEHFLARGILAFTEMMADYRQLAVYREAARRGFPVRAGLYLVWKGGRDPRGMPALTDEDRTGDHFIAGVKLFADGSISGKTAAVRNPYKTAEGEKLDYPCGMMTLEEPVFLAALSYARRNGVQLSIHIMGDRSIDAVLDWLSDVDPWLADVPSVRLEHASLLRPDQLERIDQMRLKPAFTTQIIFPFAEWRSYRASLSDADFNAAYPVKSIAERLDAFALSSDAPCTTWADPDSVFVSLAAAVTRRDADDGVFGPDEAVSVGTALALYTGRAALVMPENGQIGVIEPGARANFIRLSGNPFMTAPSKLAELRVTGIWRDGAKLELPKAD